MYIPSSNLTNEIPGQQVEGMGDLRVEAPHEKAGMWDIFVRIGPTHSHASHATQTAV